MTTTAGQQRLIGESPAFLEILEHSSSVAVLDKPVLIVGERGTGKELIAARIHYLSKRWDQTYLQTNCAALSEELIDSDLFGHEAGAFTGASKRHIGRFERAHQGTLFLDELATLSGRIQEKLLRVIEYREFERLGSQQTLQSDVRVIAATNEDLPSLAAENKFRHDLLDRLSFDVITLPPLRHRQEDILLLAEHFGLNMAIDQDKTYLGFSSNACCQLLEYDWPGNIRELKNTVERSVYRWQNPEEPIDKILFDPFASPYRPQVSYSTVKSDHNAVLQVAAHQNPRGDSKTANQQSNRGHSKSPQHSFPLDIKAAVQDYEIEIIREALKRNQYNQSQAAEDLQLTYHQMRAYIRKFKADGIDLA